MATSRRFWPVFLAGVALGLAALACDPSARAPSTPPRVAILSPESGSSVEVGETVSVEVMAEDPDGPGVFRLDLQLDGLVVDTFEAAGPQAELGATLAVTPAEEGASTLAAIAYREDGTPSEAVTVSISVTADAVGTGASTAEETTDEDEEEASPADKDAESEAAAVQASATRDVEVLAEPGVGCEVIGEVPRDEVIDLLRRTTGEGDHYYQTDYLGEDGLGWVFNEALKLRADDGELPRDPEATCLYCGDGTCSADADENCGTCADDCGACAAAAPQPQAPAGACAAGPGACCGDGVCQTDESGSWCGDCPEGYVGTGGTGGAGGGGGGGGDDDDDDPPQPSGGGDWGQSEPVCGDGVVEGGEVCDPPLATHLAPSGDYFFTCSEDCREHFNSGTGYCGDGFALAAIGEECDPPGSFCAHEKVGDVVIEVECASDCTCPG